MYFPKFWQRGEHTKDSFVGGSQTKAAGKLVSANYCGTLSLRRSTPELRLSGSSHAGAGPAGDGELHPNGTSWSDHSQQLWMHVLNAARMFIADVDHRPT